MTTAYYCVLIAGILPIIWVGYAKFSSGFALKHNFAPRTFLDSVHGKAQRANWAQLNSWEAFAPFAAAVIIANLCTANPDQVDLLAVVFILARILYGIFYIIDKPTLRSVAWSAGFFCTLGLYYLAAVAPR